MAFSATTNAFLATLINKFALQEVRTKTYNNKLSVFKKETIPYGFDAEYLHTNPATLSDYTQPNFSTHKYTDPFATNLPTTFSEYLTVNENQRASVTLVEDTILDAFTSYEKFDSLVQSIVNSLYSGNQIWEEKTIKQLFGVAVNSKTAGSEVMTPVTSLATGQAALLQMLNASDLMTFAGSSYNTVTGVVTFCDTENQRILVRSDFWNALKVYNYSAAFHDDFITLAPRVTVVDCFINAAGNEDANILAVICDEAFLQFRDRVFEVNSIINPADMSINYWLRHRAMTGVIPYANALAFVETAIA